MVQPLLVQPGTSSQTRHESWAHEDTGEGSVTRGLPNIVTPKITRRRIGHGPAFAPSQDTAGIPVTSKRSLAIS